MIDYKRVRCFGGQDDLLMASYHDNEWGVPVHEDKKLFEFLCLESMQAGLSWKTILHKRDNFRKCFDEFDPLTVSKYTNNDKLRLFTDPGIVRNRLKINALVNNAKRFILVQQEYGTFDRYIWQFTGYKTIRMHGEVTLDKLPTQTEESRALSKDLQSRGFKFVGPTICYAHMQAIGMVNDHISACFRAP